MKVPRWLNYFKQKYQLFTLKRYTTLSGTLVFFFIMSLVPLSFWLSLLLGKLPIDVESFLNLPVFESVKGVLQYIQTEARKATSGASIFLVLTTLYSASNFFYQMRRSGEIIYGFSNQKEGFKLRFSALLLLFAIIVIIIVAFAIFSLFMYVISNIFPSKIVGVVDYFLLIAISFLLVLLLNMYVCPYKRPIKDFIFGSLCTVAAWTIAVIGFSIYLKFSAMDRLYGALTTIILFLLWLYVLTIGFVVGVILNSEKIKKGVEKKF